MTFFYNKRASTPSLSIRFLTTVGSDNPQKEKHLKRALKISLDHLQASYQASHTAKEMLAIYQEAIQVPTDSRDETISQYIEKAKAILKPIMDLDNPSINQEDKKKLIALINHITMMSPTKARQHLQSLWENIVKLKDKHLLGLLAHSGVNTTVFNAIQTSLGQAYIDKNYPLFILLLNEKAVPTESLLAAVIRSDSADHRFKKALLNQSRFPQINYDINRIKDLKYDNPWDEDLHRYYRSNVGFCRRLLTPTDKKSIHTAMKIGLVVGPLIGLALTFFSSELWLFAIPMSVVMKAMAALAGIIEVFFGVSIPGIPPEVLNAPFLVNYIFPVVGLALYAVAASCAFGAIAYLVDTVKTIAFNTATGVSDTISALSDSEALDSPALVPETDEDMAYSPLIPTS